MGQTQPIDSMTKLKYSLANDWVTNGEIMTLMVDYAKGYTASGQRMVTRTAKHYQLGANIAKIAASF